MLVLTHTIINPRLADTEQFHVLTERKPEALIEWAARLCYNSNAKFGASTEFIPGLIKVGHLDVLEHVSLAVKLKFYDLEPEARYYWHYIAKKQHPYLDIIIRDNSAILSANMRVWLEMQWNNFEALDAFSEQDKVELQYYMHYICPHIIAKPSNRGGDNHMMERCASIYNRVCKTIKNFVTLPATLHPDIATDVTLLGYSGYFKEDKIFFATLQYDGVSRAFMAQHTRHRLLSHSVMSQRYVDQSNSWPVIPENISLDTRLEVEKDYMRTMQLYTKLRSSNKKEDARMILPNCTNTSMVSSSNLWGWLHYLKLRTAKDAQYEIRQAALIIEQLLNQILGGR